MAKVLVISDLQEPFSHPKTVPFLASLKRTYNPTDVICIGDEADFKFLKYSNINDPDSATAQHQMAVARLKEIYKLFPNVKVCNSNHVTDRLEYASNLANIPKFLLKSTRDILEAPDGWEWGDHWEIDGVRYEHGHHIKGGQRACTQAINQRHQSCVFGHHPLLEVKYRMVNGKSLFGMCVGALVVSDNDKRMGYGMAYSRKYGGEMPLGSGIVISGEYALPIPLRV